MESTSPDRALVVARRPSRESMAIQRSEGGGRYGQRGHLPTSGRDSPLARRWSLTDQSGRGDPAGCNRRDQRDCTSGYRSLYLREGDALCLAGRSTKAPVTDPNVHDAHSG
jgi:hypothetical protein